jgi:hypothetical protein
MRSHPALVEVAFAVVLLLGSSARLPVASAQAPGAAIVATGSVVGVVRDPSGAVVAGVTVALRSESAPDNPPRTTATDAAGMFRFEKVLPGPYRLEVAVPGFSRFVRAGVAVRTGQPIRLDVELREAFPAAPRATLPTKPPVILPAPPRPPAWGTRGGGPGPRPGPPANPPPRATPAGGPPGWGAHRDQVVTPRRPRLDVARPF